MALKKDKILVRCFTPDGKVDCVYWTQLNKEDYISLRSEAEDTEEGPVARKDYQTDVGLGYREYVFAN